MNKSKRFSQITTFKTSNMKEAKTFEAYPSPLTPLTDEEFKAEQLPEEWRGFAYWDEERHLQVLDPE